MNQLFVARYTSSRNGVEADVIILLQAIEGDLGVLVHRIILVVSVRLSPKHKPQRWSAHLRRTHTCIALIFY